MEKEILWIDIIPKQDAIQTVLIPLAKKNNISK